MEHYLIEIVATLININWQPILLNSCNKTHAFSKCSLSTCSRTAGSPEKIHRAAISVPDYFFNFVLFFCLFYFIFLPTTYDVPSTLHHLIIKLWCECQKDTIKQFWKLPVLKWDHKIHSINFALCGIWHVFLITSHLWKDEIQIWNLKINSVPNGLTTFNPTQKMCAYVYTD